MTTDSTKSPKFEDPKPAEGFGSFIENQLNKVNEKDSSRKLLDLKSEFSVTLSVNNIESTVAWYIETFGFQVDRKNVFPDFGTTVITVKGGEGAGIRLEFLQDKNFKPLIRPNPPAHSEHQFVTQLQFFVDNLDSFVDKVKARGDIDIAWDLVDIKPLRMKHFFIRDPEDNLLQFTEPY
jgi:methylmalonyl-CoA/ethylmalonyl-CoA epimerase